MNDPNRARYRGPQDLAGQHYEVMMRSKEATLEYLSAPDYRLRLAAILICQSTWNCDFDVQLVDACTAIADSDADDSTRSAAIGALATALSSTKQPNVSQFLANLATKRTTPNEVRIEAYWALRDVQFGRGDADW